ncbi:MAG: hypothetical protein H8D43_02155 [Chloroflexi bacterium]|nr:hypothetical protein [Chloroflexota bacterium]
MFKLERIIAFGKQLLRRAIPIMIGLLCLATIAELQARRVELAGTQSRATFWMMVARSTVPRLADAWASRVFWLEVVRDMLPGIAVLVIALEISARFVRSLYKLNRMGEARSFVRRMLFGQMGFPPWLLIGEGKLPEDENQVVMRVGGPGHLVIYNDTAVLLEQAGRLTRIEKQGFPGIKPFETVYDVVDLRPKRKLHAVKAMTKEGIPVTCEVDIGFKIEDGGQVPTKDEPYPAQENAILKAITSQWKCDTNLFSSGKLNWEDLVVLGYADGPLRSILARYPLDQLIEPVEEGGSRKSPRQAIREELEKELRREVPALGAKIMHVDLGDIIVEDEVTQQWIDAWQTEWVSWRKKRQALGEAEYAQQVEIATAQAQVDMIVAITEAVQSLDTDDPQVASQHLLLRLVTMLRRASSDPWTRAFLPSHVMRTLNEFK